MQSNLSITEFRHKLKDVTKIGHPKLKLSPFAMFSMFGDSSKIFYGLYDNSTFSLTSNFKINPTSFIVRGRYKTVNGKLQIQYKVVPRFKYQLYWWVLLPIFGFSFFNYTLLLHYNESSMEKLIIINSFLTFMISFAYFDITRKKRKLEKNFIEIFEIMK